MAQLGVALNPNEIETPQSEFDLIPDGWYVAQVVGNEEKATQSGTGRTLTLEWEIMEGEFERRKIWQRINYINDSKKAATIGQGQIKKICIAINFTEILENGDQLMYQPALIKVGKDKPQDGYEPRNEIKGVKELSATPPEVKAPATARPAIVRPAATPRPAASGPVGNRPWGNKTAAPAEEIPF